MSNQLSQVRTLVGFVELLRPASEHSVFLSIENWNKFAEYPPLFLMTSMNSYIPTTRNQVPLHSSEHQNNRIRRTLLAHISYFAAHRDQITERLDELDQEWDIERAIEANAAVIGFTGIALAAGQNRAGWRCQPW